MKIFKNEYGYSTCGFSKDMTGVESKLYYSIGFKKGTEPQMTADQDCIEAELLFKTKDGTRPCFLSCYKAKDGTIKPKIVVMGDKNIIQNKEEDNSHIIIDENDLPFY